ncbi:hypothetical protein TGCAST_299120 [Toxoplasma gondii CAST]|uniref:Uncharacterized protein n=1 Tax=Toxoplasma gondii CAST TaxID=943122 RepID=A0A3R8G346_TOXGO|nr:hypothetical protein TGCAST_299120 [Toxoplasma gondii CAST]
MALFFDCMRPREKKTSGGTARHLHLSGDTEKSASPSADDRHKFVSSLSCFGQMPKFISPVSHNFGDLSACATQTSRPSRRVECAAALTLTGRGLSESSRKQFSKEVSA